MENNKLIEFYKKCVTGIGLSYDDEDFIRTGSDPKSAPIFINDGRSLVLPTAEHIKTATRKNSDNEIEVIKMLYNPMNENTVKNENPSLIITKRAIETKLSYALAAAGSLLLTVAANEELYDKVDIDVSKFITSLNEISTEARKKLVDDKSIDHWIKMCNQTYTGETKLISLYLAKNGKYKDIKYVRSCKLNSPLYDLINEAKKDTSIYGMKLRPKEIDAYKLVFKFLLNMLEEDGTYTIGSNNGESPAFISLMKMYIEVGTWINKIITDLSTINEETVDMAKINIDIDIKELDNLNIYISELKLIPSEVDLSRSKLVMPTANVGTLIKGTTTTVPRKDLTPLSLREPEPVVTGNPDKDFLTKMYGAGKHVQRDTNPFSPSNLFGQSNQGFGNAINSNPFNRQTNVSGGFGNTNPFNQPTNPFSNPFSNSGNNSRF